MRGVGKFQNKPCSQISACIYSKPFLIIANIMIQKVVPVMKHTQSGQSLTCISDTITAHQMGRLDLKENIEEDTWNLLEWDHQTDAHPRLQHVLCCITLNSTTMAQTKRCCQPEEAGIYGLAGLTFGIQIRLFVVYKCQHLLDFCGTRDGKKKTLNAMKPLIRPHLIKYKVLDHQAIERYLILETV